MRYTFSTMETFRTMTSVKGGRITVEVPAGDGTGVDVIVIPRRTPVEVEALLQEADRLRTETVARAPEPETLKQWVEEGRP